MAIQDQMQALYHQMVAYLRTTPAPLTTLYWPRPVSGWSKTSPQGLTPMQANRPTPSRATPQ